MLFRSHKTNDARDGLTVLHEVYKSNFNHHSIVVPTLNPGDMIMFTEAMVHGDTGWRNPVKGSYRMQVYFIDNQEFFSRKAILTERASNKYFEDNDERAMFFARGVAETVKKLGWQPDIIHCHGWFTSLLPLYIKKYYNDDPIFADSKMVVSVYNDEYPKTLNKKLSHKLTLDGFNKKDVKHISEEPNFINMLKQSIEFSDGVIQGSDSISADLVKHIKKTGKPFLEIGRAHV